MSEEAVKEILHRIPYGFYSLTSKAGEDVNIMVCNWIVQASFEPRLLAVALQKTSYSHGLVEKGRVFCLNLFNKTDEEAIKAFTKSRAKNPDKVKNAVYRPAKLTGCPVPQDAAAYLECEVKAIVDVGGDHDLVIGGIIGGEVLKPGEVTDTLSLLDLGWSYAG